MWTDLDQVNPISQSKAAPDVTKRTGCSAKEIASLNRVLELKDAFFLNFALLFAYVLILNREGVSVPSNNEHAYLLYLAKQWNPDFLSIDWTFSGTLPSHLVFNLIFGPLTLLFPLEHVGWIGRILSWSLILLALLQLGRHFQIPLWMVTVSILLWLFNGQSIVGGEWILGTFEAKCIAYALLFFSLHGFMHRRWIWSSILLGLAVSFHPLVGFWSALGVGLSLIVLRYPIDTIVKFGCYTALFAVPGLLPLLMTGFKDGPESSEVWRFVTLVVMPYHFDPFDFGRSKSLLLQLVILLCFNWLHLRLDSKSQALRFLVSFQTFLGLFFILSFLARYLDNYKLLILMPGRLFPVLLPLFFFFHFMSALHHCYLIKGRKSWLVVGFLSFATFGNPLEVFEKNLRKHYRMWTRLEQDERKSFNWIRENTPANSIVISPPWRGDSFYHSQRPQVASWWIIRLDNLIEWRERLESLGGKVSESGTLSMRIEQMKYHYNHLTATQITSLSKKYEAEYLVSSAQYSYPVLFNSGTYKVYSLKGNGPSGR